MLPLQQSQTNVHDLGFSPINTHKLQKYLDGYQPQKANFLIEGFTFGFKIGYSGPRTFRSCRNLVSSFQHSEVVYTKLHKEVQLGRIAGPFSHPPFPNLQCSPVGVVPKKEQGSFRLIHHLSYPEGSSINDHIPDHLCHVTYASVDDAIAMIKTLGKHCLLAKTDIDSAFRIIPIHPEDYDLLGIQFQNKFFFDKCLPMGCSSSCAIFESFSTSLQWIAQTKFQIPFILHVLDDFLFLGPGSTQTCLSSLLSFQNICNELGIPIKHEKTEGPSTVLCFLGIELDTDMFQARLPPDKIDKILLQLHAYKNRKKITLKELQSLIGLLNFACTVVVPGRAFLRRLIDLTTGVKKSRHKIRLNKEARADMAAWLSFMNNFNGKSFFLDDRWHSSANLHFYTDAASSLGFGAIFQTKRFYGLWPNSEFNKFHITVKELFPIVLAVEIWGSLIQNQCIVFHSDNEAVVHIINKTSSKDKILMRLVRRLVLACMKHNILFRSEHIPGKHNILSDHLSRLQVLEFRRKAPHMDGQPTPILLHHLII